MKMAIKRHGHRQATTWRTPRTRVGVLLLPAMLGSGALAIGCGSCGAPVTPNHVPAPRQRPNVLVIETDDQTAQEMSVMRNVNFLIAAKGVTFKNSFVNFSLCCPSRATFLTGQYAHNHGVLSNDGPHGGYQTFERTHGKNDLPAWLLHAGYRTALIGKYLNGYGTRSPTFVPPGWSSWYAAVGHTDQQVYDYLLNENGHLVHYGTAPADFKQDVLTSKAVRLLGHVAPKPKPFFLWLTYTAPHVGGPDPNPNPPHDCAHDAKPAPRHAGSFASWPLPKPPSFNEANVLDKVRNIRRRPPIGAGEVAQITQAYRCELESLLSVDQGVRRIIDELKRKRELANTYVLFTSDNGFFHGEHRITAGKVKPYEESIRVPLVIRGPGIPHGATSRSLVINADLAPTITAVTGAAPRLAMDGRSLLPAARHPGALLPRRLLIEGRRQGRAPAYTRFGAVRTQHDIYVAYRDGEKELYDLRRDPYELHNLVREPAYQRVAARLARSLRELEKCSGVSCRR
ncbi:MAG: sulfatase family protein [Solirubrobacterales bacterium]